MPKVDLTASATSEGLSKCAKPLTMNALMSSVRAGIDSSDSSFCKGPVKVGASAESPAQRESCIARSRFLLGLKWRPCAAEQGAPQSKGPAGAGWRWHEVASAGKSIVHFLFKCK